MKKCWFVASLVLAVAALPARAIDVIFVDKPSGKEFEIRAADTTEGPDGILINKGQVYEVTYRKVAMRTVRETKVSQAIKPPIKLAPAAVKDYQLREDDVKPVPYLLEFRTPMSNFERAANPELKEADRLKLLKDALPLFQAVTKNLLPNSKAKRHTDYRHAETLYLLSLVDDKYRDDAIKALEEYGKTHGRSWHISLALTYLARLQEDKNDLAAVQQTYEKLAALEGLSEEQKTDSLIAASRTLMKTEKFGEAKARLQQLLAGLPGDSPLRSKVQVYLAQCQVLGDNPAEAQAAEGQLKELLKAAEDTTLKALAHNTLGDYYAKLKRDEDAFWEYLRVDTLYSDDRFEHSRALYHLVRLFRDVKKDADRADACLELLTKNPRFTGLEYQKKAMKK